MWGYLCSVLKRANICLLDMKPFSTSRSFRLSTCSMYFFSFSCRGRQTNTIIVTLEKRRFLKADFVLQVKKKVTLKPLWIQVKQAIIRAIRVAMWLCVYYSIKSNDKTIKLYRINRSRFWNFKSTTYEKKEATQKTKRGWMENSYCSAFSSHLWFWLQLCRIKKKPVNEKHTHRKKEPAFHRWKVLHSRLATIYESVNLEVSQLILTHASTVSPLSRCLARACKHTHTRTHADASGSFSGRLFLQRILHLNDVKILTVKFILII